MDAFALEESQNLSIFFATNNSITNMLKKALEEVRGYGGLHLEVYLFGGLALHTVASAKLW